MKKIFFSALLVCFFCGFLSAAAFAEDVDPCSEKVWQMMKHHADAKRVEAEAYAFQTIRRNDPVEGLTCFDQQLKLTAHLGSFFSDKDIKFKLPIGDLFCGLLGPNIPVTLSTSIKNVVLSTLDDILGNFLGSLSFDLFPELASMLTSINGFLESLNFSVCLPTLTLPTIGIPNNPLAACLPKVCLPPVCLPPPPCSPPVCVAGVCAQAVCAPRLCAPPVCIGGGGNIGGQSFGGQCIGMKMPTIDCDRIGKLWSVGNSTVGSIAIEGGGVQPGTPYMSLADLLSGAPASMITDFQKQLGQTTNSALLRAAFDDLTTTLSAPGAIPSWPMSPTFPDDSSTFSIIQGM